jgi:signal transduction histidine kinase
MNKRLVAIVVLVIASLALLLVSQYLSKSALDVRLYRPNVKHLERIVERETTYSGKLAREFLGKVNSNASSRQIFESGVEFKRKLEGKWDGELFLFSHDTLCFWSCKLDVSGVPFDSSQVGLVKIQSEYFFTQWFTAGKGLQLLVLNPIYSEYPYQNKYLKNSFSPLFKEFNNYRISIDLVSNAIPVRPHNVAPFYLVPLDIYQNGHVNRLWPILQWIAFAMAVCAVLLIFGQKFFRYKPLLKIAGATAGIFIIRYLSLYMEIPSRSGMKIFNPEIYAHSFINPSLGDFFINAILVFMLVLFIRQSIRLSLRHIKNMHLYLLAASVLILFLALFPITDKLLTSLVTHSTLTLEPYRIFSLSVYSIIGYLSVSLWAASAVILTITWVSVVAEQLSLKQRLILLVSGLLVVTLLSLALTSKPSGLGLVWMWLTVAYVLLVYRSSKTHLLLRHILVIVTIFSAYSVSTVFIKTSEKELNVRKVLAINLSSERDPLAEMLLPNLYQKMLTDSYIRDCIRNIEQKNADLYSYLRKDYFKNYLNRYDLRATVCSPSSIINVDGKSTLLCDRFFGMLIGDYGIMLPSSRFYYLNTQSGFISYVGEINYRIGDNIRNLYIELTSRPGWEMLGYPELLIEGRASQQQLKEYSWAKYHNGNLITQSGEFPFRQKVSGINPTTQVFTCENFLGYNHLTYRPGSSDIVVISRPREKLLNVTASFAYCLFLYFVMFLLCFKIADIPLRLIPTHASFKNRITRAIILIVTLSLLMVGAATIAYNIKNFEQRNEKNLSEKLISIMFELDRDVDLIQSNDPSAIGFLSDRLVELSNIFYTDINIYDTTGMLLATSRSEIFEKQLVGPRMNPAAWHELATNHSPKFLDNENIGKAKFLSAYVPILSSNREAIAYLNLPYFTRQEELRSELYSIVVAIVNIYALLTLIAISIAIIISSQITRPLQLIRERIGKVSITGNNQTINYSSDDEVGQLIGEYNRMVNELTRSANELARNQRESAWREMAMQVAHEVKNPLTPIKLSLQHLVKAKKDNLPDWDARFERFAQSLLEQIESLAVIASEFSLFAKLPSAKREPVKLLDIINDTANLYRGYRNVALNVISYMEAEPLVLADKEQLIRVFNNLIKNAIQSIERGKDGKVTITLAPENDLLIRVDVTDNGVGIPEEVLPKLFTPNFTTKSGGTGLGLAISREIVLGFGGEILVKTQKDLGTTFSVLIPFLKH